MQAHILQNAHTIVETYTHIHLGEIRYKDLGIILTSACRCCTNWSKDSSASFTTLSQSTFHCVPEIVSHFNVKNVLVMPMQ